MGLPALYIIGLKREAFILTTALAITTAVTCALKDIMCGPRPVHVVGAAAASVGAAHAAQGLNTAHAGHADGMHAAHGDGTGGGSRQATKVPRIEVREPCAHRCSSTAVCSDTAPEHAAAAWGRYCCTVYGLYADSMQLDHHPLTRPE